MPVLFVCCFGLIACAESDADPTMRLAPEGDARADDGGAQDAAPDGALVDAGPPPEGAAWFIVLNDTTTGFGVGVSFGSDLDAATWQCPDGRSGAGIAASGQPSGAAAESPLDGAIGAPDGPCSPLVDCAAHVGAGGWLAVEVRSTDLSGCTVSLHELADGGDDQFELWLCSDAALTADCVGPLAAGRDGEIVTGEVP